MSTNHKWSFFNVLVQIRIINEEQESTTAVSVSDDKDDNKNSNQSKENLHGRSTNRYGNHERFLRSGTKDRRNTQIQGRTYRQEAYVREI